MYGGSVGYGLGWVSYLVGWVGSMKIDPRKTLRWVAFSSEGVLEVISEQCKFGGIFYARMSQT